MIFFTFLIPLLLLVFATVVSRKIEQGWLAPGPFLGLFWLGYLITPLILAPDYYVGTAAVWCIAVFVIIFITGTVFGGKIPIGRTNEAVASLQKIDPDCVTLRFYLLASASLGMLAVVFLLRSKGYSVQALTSIDSLAAIGREFAVARYQNDFVPPITARIMMASVYFSGLIGGTLYAMSRGCMDRLCSIIPFIPVLLYGAVLTSRAPVLYSMLLWLSGFLAILIFEKKGRIALFTTSNIFIICLGVAGIVGLFILFSMFRYDMLSFSFIADILLRLRVWFFGFLAGFSQWYDSAYLLGGDLGFGRYTFSGIFNALGLFTREMGIFTGFEQISDIAEGINVYTLFRGLLEDFGLFGTVMLLAGSGVFCGYSYRQVVQGNLRFVPILAIFFAITLWSNVTSIFNYNSILLALLSYSLLILGYSNSRK